MARNFNQQQRKQTKHKLNSDVRFPQVRVVGSYEGKIMTSFEASKIAESEGLDLILITENANPPVVRIENYNKFIYELEKKEKEIQKNSHKVELKEISLSVTIADHDLGVKSKKAIEFLSEGNKVKCNLLMKGRQNTMKEQGQLVMLKFAKLVEEVGVPESMPKLDGTKWIMILKPKKSK